MPYIRLAVPAPGFPNTFTLFLSLLSLIALSTALMPYRNQFGALWTLALGSHLMVALSVFFPLTTGPWGADISAYGIITWSLSAGDWQGLVARCLPQLLGMTLLMSECIVMIFGFDNPTSVRRGLYFFVGVTWGCVVLGAYLLQAFNPTIEHAIRLSIFLICVIALLGYRLLRKQWGTHATQLTLVQSDNYRSPLPRRDRRRAG